jgi:hypothetical protein
VIPLRSCVLKHLSIKIYEFGNPKATKVEYSALNIITKAIHRVYFKNIVTFNRRFLLTSDIFIKSPHYYEFIL